jgi:hypothetical protein
VRKFGKAIWDITGKGVNVDIVFEHPGEATFPVSTFVCKRGGMVVICAGTTGFNLTMDARYVWMHQKRVQGSHFAHLKQAAAANKLMIERRIDPCMSEVFPWEELPQAHIKMLRNEHKPGNMSVLVQAPRTGCGRWKTCWRPGPPPADVGGAGSGRHPIDLASHGLRWTAPLPRRRGAVLHLRARPARGGAVAPAYPQSRIAIRAREPFGAPGRLKRPGRRDYQLKVE